MSVSTGLSPSRGMVLAILTILVVLLITVTACSSAGPDDEIKSASAPLTVTETVTIATTQAEQPRTQSHHISPASRDGEVQEGWSQRGGEEVLDYDCYSSPVALSPDIYTCGPSVFAAHACFQVADVDALYCPDGPFNKQFRKINFTGPRTEVDTPSPSPWGLVLEDGRQCLARQGGAWGTRTDGYYGIYSCSGEDAKVVLAAEGAAEFIDKSRDIWTVHIGELGIGPQELPPPRTVAVTDVYFAAWAE